MYQPTTDVCNKNGKIINFKLIITLKYQPTSDVCNKNGKINNFKLIITSKY